MIGQDDLIALMAAILWPHCKVPSSAGLGIDPAASYDLAIARAQALLKRAQEAS
jgi:hypothetical protein